MSDQTVVNIARQDPAIEAYRLGLLGDVQQFTRDQIAQGIQPPSYQVAGLGPDGQLLSTAEQAALQQAQQGVGQFAPFMQGGLNVLGQGQQAAQMGVAGLQQGIQTMGAAQPMLGQAQQQLQADGFGQQAAQTGIGALAGTGGRFDPSQISPFMSGFEDAAVQQTLADIQRQGDIAGQGVRAQAVGAGAFGGARSAIAEQELQRNVLEQQARTAAQMRAGGFESAAQRAQQAFEQQQARQQQAANLTGHLGLQFGQLGQQDVQILSALAGRQAEIGQGIGGLAGQFGTIGSQLGQLGGQQAAMGGLATELRGMDIDQLMRTSSMQRGLEQSALDAQRMTDTARQAQPYQQYGFLSDIYSGVPTSQSTITASSVPQVSPFQTAIGLGIQGLSAAAGASRAGLI